MGCSKKSGGGVAILPRAVPRVALLSALGNANHKVMSAAHHRDGHRGDGRRCDQRRPARA